MRQEQQFDRELERAEHAAMRTQWAGLGAAVVSTCGSWTALGWPALPDHPWLHQVVGHGEGLADALAVLAAHGIAHAQVPVAGPPPDLLVERGVPGPPQLRMVAPSGGVLPSCALRLEVVGPERADDVVAVASVGFGADLPAWWAAPLGRPGWTQVGAYDGDDPVAVGGLHVTPPVAYVGAAATLPAARRRGAHAALLALRLRLAAQQGARRVSVRVEASSASSRNLERAGFRVAHEVVPWRAATGAAA